MPRRVITDEQRKLSYTPEVKARAAETKRVNKLVRTAINDELRNLLLNDNAKGKAYYQEFLQKFLAQAKANVNSPAARLVAETIFHREILQMLDAENDKIMNKDLDFLRYRCLKEFFKEQRDVIMDTNHQKRILACCSRRAGKTDLAPGAICHAAIIPDSRIVYINLTFSNAINQLWENLMTKIEKVGLTIAESHKNEGTITFSNGSSVRIIGNSNNAEIDKLRGESKVSLVIIDEFFHQRNMQYGINEVISPLLADRADSTLLCMGTPPRLAHTFGEKCWNGTGWKKYHWTMFENPYMPKPEEYLDDLCKSRGISKDDPFVQREYYGIIGQYDTEALVFKGRQTYDKLPDVKFTKIAIGVDYGFSDYNSIISIGYNDKEEAFEIKSDKFNKAGVSDIISVVKAHYENAKRFVDEDKIAIYADTNEESITMDLRNLHHLPAFNAYKYDKQYAIETLAEVMRVGKLKIQKGGILDEEMEQILYKRDEDTDAIIPELDEDIGIHPDAMMALLYASRRIFFDWNYDIQFKESAPKTSDFKVDKTGTITDFNNDVVEEFDDIGTIG